MYLYGYKIKQPLTHYFINNNNNKMCETINTIDIKHIFNFNLQLRNNITKNNFFLLYF